MTDFDAGLLLLWRTLDDLVPSSETQTAELRHWQLEAESLSSDLTASRLTSEGLVTSLEDSLRREESTRAAAEARARLDAEAVTRARGERDGWILATGITSILAALTLAWGLSR